MAAFICSFWWLLLGVLLGWLASWLLGRSSKIEPTTSDGIDYAAARAAGYLISSPQNLEIIEGIGPVIANLLRANGIGTFSQLAMAPMSALQSVLANAGSRFRTANPQTWAEQAALAAGNRWSELRRYQDQLDAGIRRV
jgi:predicted flap endonuclease-1-like 5' DNA nuclease